MRVIAGSARGRRLVTPAGRATRPTGDRVKEALFSSLGALDDVVLLDLYAGSGGLGIEALSRGAAQVVFVEQDPKALAAIIRNLETTQLAQNATVVRNDVARFCREPSQFVGRLHADVVLMDPPYDEPQATLFTRLHALHEAQTLAADALVVIERDRRSPDPDPPLWLARERVRTYGDTVLRYFRVQSPMQGPKQDSDDLAPESPPTGLEEDGS